MKPNKTPQGRAAFASSRRQTRKWMTAVACMAVLVAFGTIWALMMPAATLEGEAHCGLTEHTHNESCYESVLVCGQEEGSGHVHDDSCYETVLTCEIPEHTHTDECYAQSETGNETGTEAVKEDGTGTGAGTETGTGSESTGSNNGTATGTETGAGETGNAGTDAGTGTGNAGTGSAGNNGSAGTGTAGGQDGTSGTGNTGSGTGTEDKTGAGSGTEEADGQDEDALTEDGKAEDAQNSQAAEKAADMPGGAEIPEGYTEQYTVRDDENGFAVTVYAPEGVVPEGAVLSAALLEENDDAYAKAEQELAEETEKALAENGIDLQSEDGETVEPSYGFAALDIHFEDADGNEVEPNGQVYVVIDAAGLIPEDADPDSVTVQHHAEQEDAQVAVETVADTTDSTDTGVVAVVENADQDKNDVQAAFEVDGFSTFTIYYEYNRSLSVVVVNENYVPIGNDNSSSFTNIGITWTPVENIAAEIMDSNGLSDEEYEFDHAEIQWQGGRTADVADIRYSRGFMGFGAGFQYRTESSDGNENSFPSNYTLYFIFNEKESGGNNPGGGTVTENATVTTTKTAELREDGNYDLTLSITGDRGSSSQKQLVDVVFILDNSGSMDRRITDNEDAGRWEDSRMDLLKSSVDSLIDTVEANDNINAQYNIVRFAGVTGGQNGTTSSSGWRSGSEAKTYVDDLNPSGGTNYQAGISEAKDQLADEDAREGAITFVIFVSDGIPTFRGNNDAGNGQNDNDGQNISAAVDEISTLSCDYFYAIGMGPDFGQEWQGRPGSGGWVDKEGTQNLKKLANAVDATSKGDNNVFSANDTDDLEAAFNRITSEITFFAASDVTITDPLSEYADLVLTDNAPQFTISITDGTNTWSDTVENNGTLTFYDADDTAQTATARVSEDNRTIYLDLPDDYELEEGYTYSISTVITPSQAAISAGMNSEAAKQTPDDGTGTHANDNEQGFWSNDNENAKVTYTANDEEGSENFPKPVIQVQEPETGDLTITKEVSGATVENKLYSFTISTQTAAVDGKAYATNVEGTYVTFSSSADGSYTAEVNVTANSISDSVDGRITIIGLPLGNYTVTEDITDVTIKGYRFDGVAYQVNSSQGNGANMTTENTDVTVAVTNTYTQVTDITIHKVDGAQGDLDGAEFQLINEDEEYYTYDADTQTVRWSSEQHVLVSDASDGSIFYVQGLEDGKYTLIETKAPDGYQILGNAITINIVSGIARSEGNVPNVSCDNNIITITNTRGEILPETGGPGTTILTIGGLLLMAGAVGGGYGLRRRRGKEGR